MNLLEFYNTNESFKSYVDKYCFKHQVFVTEALTHATVIAYASWIRSNH